MHLTVEEQEDWNKENNVENETINEPKTKFTLGEILRETSGKEGEGQPITVQKYISLYRARTILSLIGTMEERRISKNQLKRMKKLGLNSI